MKANLKLLTGKTIGVYRNELEADALYLYGPIGNIFGEEGMTASKVKDEVNNMKHQDITIHIHSYGGDAFEGIAIYNVLKQSGKKITVCVDGIAASAASIVVMGGNIIQMPKNTQLMIHNAATGLFGTEKDFKIATHHLKSTNEVLKKTYLERFKGTEKELTKFMDDETFFSAEEALKQGLIDEVLKYDSKPIGDEQNTQNYSGSLKNSKDTKVSDEVLEQRVQRFAAFINSLSKISGGK